MGSESGYKPYEGGNEDIDRERAPLKAAYYESKERGDAAGMRMANDEANKILNKYGYAAEYANEDIAKIAAAGQSSGGLSRSAGSAAYFVPVNNYSDYIRQMNEARQAAALAELEAAYKKNVAALDESQVRIAPAYQEARNKTAAQGEQAKRNFAERASAYGLNSGASGQAELARSVTLQSNLGRLNAAEADAYSALQHQRTQLGNEYNAAIAAARSKGDYELAGALYQEAARIDSALSSRQLQQLQTDYQRERDAVSDSHYAQSVALSQRNTDYNQMLNLAKIMAQYGDFSGYRDLGIDTKQMERAYREQQMAR